MQLEEAVNATFRQLSGSLQKLSPAEYIQPCKTLHGNTIGQHVRHVIELFQCLEKGYATGTVNYEKRKRDPSIETDKELATGLMEAIGSGLDKDNKELNLEAIYEESETNPILIRTNYYREIAYNLEHTIHHMALIRVGVTEVSKLVLPDNFGVSSSTLKYRRQCAQ